MVAGIRLASLEWLSLLEPPDMNRSQPYMMSTKRGPVKAHVEKKKNCPKYEIRVSGRRFLC